jgi:hypothetical protein
MDQFFKQLFSNLPKEEPLSPGLYTYHTPPEAPEQFRLHLRIEPHGEGLLIINASTVLHLNQTGTEFAYYLMQGKTEEEIIQLAAKRFNTDRETIAKDLAAFHQVLREIILKPDQLPEARYGLEILSELTDISAPYQLHCCLTKRTEAMAESASFVAEGELDTDAWRTIIKKAYDAGIPHLVFYGGEPTLREDLITLLLYCEELGLVTGLVSSCRKMQTPAYLNAILNSGLDHLIVPIDPEDAVQNEALEKILSDDLYTCVGLVINAETDFRLLIDRYIRMGANAFSLLPADEAALDNYLRASDYVEQAGSTLVMDLPFPIAMQQQIALRNRVFPSNSEREFIQLIVSPNGELISAAPFETHLGNILTEEWEVLWNRRYQN